jgi:hypothetical protein
MDSTNPTKIAKHIVHNSEIDSFLDIKLLS